MRTVVAGFGNVLRGDDGFGVEVVRRLERQGLCEGVRIVDVGIAGFQLMHELFERCDRLVIVDAMRRGGAPGSIYVSEVTAVEIAPDADMHATVPSQALGWAKAVGVLPPRVVLIGCEPAVVDELTMALSPAVEAAVEPALERIRELVANRETGQPDPSARPA